MRRDDVLGARLDPSARLRITKAEAKSRATVGEATVKAAREGMARNDALPSPHSLTQFAERPPTADSDIGEAVGKGCLCGQIGALRRLIGNGMDAS